MSCLQKCNKTTFKSTIAANAGKILENWFEILLTKLRHQPCLEKHYQSVDIFYEKLILACRGVAATSSACLNLTAYPTVASLQNQYRALIAAWNKLHQADQSAASNEEIFFTDQ